MNSRVKSIIINKPLLIVEMGKTFAEISEQHGEFSEWIQNILSDTYCETVNPRTQLLPNPLHYSGIILTGSHDMVTMRQVWSEKTSEWLHICRRLKCPILGICYGHQLLAQSFGGWVAENPKGLEIGTQVIQLTEHAHHDEIFKHLPQTFNAHLVHYQSVMQLPTGAKVLAYNQHDQYQAYRLDDCIWGVQFHPEFHLAAMHGYLDIVSKSEESCCDQAEVKHTHNAKEVLVNFKRFCEDKMTTTQQMN